MKGAQRPSDKDLTALGAGPVDEFSVEHVRSLAQLAREFELTELSLIRPSGERLRIRRAAAGAPPLLQRERPVQGPAQELAVREVPAPPDEPEGCVFVTSPFVGTFYRSPGPSSPAFVEPGQRVKKGQTLCIIEAMKLMNELEAELDGVIVACLAENGRPVEYGEKLFQIRPA